MTHSMSRPQVRPPSTLCVELGSALSTRKFHARPRASLHSMWQRGARDGLNDIADIITPILDAMLIDDVIRFYITDTHDILAPFLIAREASDKSKPLTEVTLWICQLRKVTAERD